MGKYTKPNFYWFIRSYQLSCQTEESINHNNRVLPNKANENVTNSLRNILYVAKNSLILFYKSRLEGAKNQQVGFNILSYSTII